MKKQIYYFTWYGHPIKAWVNRKKGTILPTNWKIQSSILSLLPGEIKGIRPA